MQETFLRVWNRVGGFDAEMARSAPGCWPSLATARHAELKAERAFEHLQVLEVELEKYYSNSPWSVKRYDDSERGRHG